MIELDGEKYLDGDEASNLLGVKMSTLYTYVSRGILKSYKQGIKRQRLYKQAELESLLRLQPGDTPSPISTTKQSTEETSESSKGHTCNASLHSNDLLQIEAYVIDFSASAKRCTPIRISSSLNAVLPRSKPWEFHSSMRNVDFICLLGSLYVSYFIQWLSIANMSI